MAFEPNLATIAPMFMGITPTCDDFSSLRDENLCAIAANESMAWRT
jgi:hypothetical protein